MKNSESRKLRLLFCSPALTFGGETQQIAKILKYLDRKRFDVTICCLRPVKDIDESIKKSGVPIICLDRPSPYDFRVIRDLCRVIKRNNIDLVQVGIFGSEFHGIIAAAIMRKPVVAILESGYDLDTRAQSITGAGLGWRWKWQALYAGHGIISRIAQVRYAALSEAVRDSGLKDLHLPAKLVSVVPIGLPSEEFDRTYSPLALSGLRSELGLTGAYPVLLNVARLSPPKGLPDLLGMMKRIQSHLPKAKLLIAGDGPLRNELEQQCDQLGIQDTVRFLGRRDDVPSLLHLADLFVFTSFYEGLPGAVIEAMAAGKCTIAYDIPALKNIIVNGVTGVLIPSRDSDDFVKNVVYLAQHPETAAQMGKTAQQLVRQQFDIRQNIKVLEEIYTNEIVGS